MGVRLGGPSEYAYVALSLREAAWMNAHGVPRDPPRIDEAYARFSMEELESMAAHGDADAARIGAVRALDTALVSMPADTREVWRLGMKEVYGLADEEYWKAKSSIEEFHASPAWQQRRHMLWLGAVHGSSVAAERMSYTYGDGIGRCYFAIQCDAWTLIGRRMGDWDTEFAVLARKSDRNISSSMHVANAIWSDINAARAELGMPPLGIDLRPNYVEWMKLESGGLSPPIFRR